MTLAADGRGWLLGEEELAVEEVLVGRRGEEKVGAADVFGAGLAYVCWAVSGVRFGAAEVEREVGGEEVVVVGHGELVLVPLLLMLVEVVGWWGPEGEEVVEARLGDVESGLVGASTVGMVLA